MYFFLSFQCLEHCEVQQLFDTVLPAMVDLALKAPRLCTMVGFDCCLYLYQIIYFKGFGNV